MKFIHVFLMLALIAGGYFIRDVVEPTKRRKLMLPAWMATSYTPTKSSETR
jgi:hypothetical protein